MSDARPVVMLTGCSGFIGSAIVRRLGGGHRVLGFDREEAERRASGLADFTAMDLGNEASVTQALERARERHGAEVASVIHLAAYYDFSGEPSEKYDQITVRGTERLLRALRPFRVEQFAFSSTMLVHAPCEPGERIDEDWPLEPKWDYPRSKVAAEEKIRAGHGATPYALLRIAGVYDDRCHSIPLAHQIQRVEERRLTAHVFPGDTAKGQAFLHLDDLVDAIARLVERRRELPPELTLLLGEPETLSYDELQREFARLIHGEENWTTTTIPKAVAKSGAWFQDKLQDSLPKLEEPFIKPWMIDLADDHYALDVSRAQRLLAWTPRRSLRTTLPRMIAALKADPDGWYEANGLESRVEAPVHA